MWIAKKLVFTTLYLMSSSCCSWLAWTQTTNTLNGMTICYMCIYCVLCYSIENACLKHDGTSQMYAGITSNRILIILTGANSLQVVWGTQDTSLVARYSVSCSSLSDTKFNDNVTSVVEQNVTVLDTAINLSLIHI